jgi:dephospho-CoA kinase
LADSRSTRSKSSWPRRSRGRTPSAKPKRVAITGGIGAGKSEALRAFARHGAAVISSDDIVHDLIEHEEEVRAALLDRFGTTDRAEIARIVFADRDELDWLERLLHPRVVERYERWFEQQDAPIVVAEIPLLYETGGERRFDAVVAITAPAEVREARARVPLAGRSERLLPDPDKLRRADFAYVNDGSLAELDAWVAGVVEELTA